MSGDIEVMELHRAVRALTVVIGNDVNEPLESIANSAESIASSLLVDDEERRFRFVTDYVLSAVTRPYDKTPAGRRALWKDAEEVWDAAPNWIRGEPSERSMTVVK